MELTTKIQKLRELVKQWKKEGKSIGLVPTMGYLHDGHASLIQKAVEENDEVIVSIFVNPFQFGENEDLDQYPRDINADSKLCEGLGVSLIFNPEPTEMYDNRHTVVDMETLSDGLCGSKRPGHFRGVCTVVSKLFNLCQPDRSYFGQKDAQQLAIIKKMVKDLNFDIEIIGCPIIREADGLAMSSRNSYLNPRERRAALCLSKAIQKGQAKIKEGMPALQLIEEMAGIIKKENTATIDYISVVDLENLQELEHIKKPALTAMAVYIGKTRLIDNFIFQ